MTRLGSVACTFQPETLRMTPVRMRSAKTTENSVAERRLSTAAPATVPTTRPAMTMPKERQLIEREVADRAEERQRRCRARGGAPGPAPG